MNTRRWVILGALGILVALAVTAYVGLGLLLAHTGGSTPTRPTNETGSSTPTHETPRTPPPPPPPQQRQSLASFQESTTLPGIPPDARGSTRTPANPATAV
jgi:hypothetical protein